MEGPSKLPTSISSSSGPSRNCQNFVDIFSDDEREHTIQDEEVHKTLEELPPVVDFDPRTIKMVVMTVLHIALVRHRHASLKANNDIRVKELVQEDKDFKSIVEQSYHSRSFKALRNHPALRKDAEVVNVEGLATTQMTGREATANCGTYQAIDKTQVSCSFNQKVWVDRPRRY